MQPRQPARSGTAAIAVATTNRKETTGSTSLRREGAARPGSLAGRQTPASEPESVSYRYRIAALSDTTCASLKYVEQKYVRKCSCENIRMDKMGMSKVRMQSTGAHSCYGTH